MLKASRLVTTLMAASLSTSALAADVSQRAQTWEGTIQLRYLKSNDVDFGNGTTAQLDSSFGWGLGFAYNLNEKLALGFDFGWNSVGYSANAVPQAGSGNSPISLTGTVVTSSMLLAGTYYFLERDLTPFVTGNIGSIYIDTGVPEGPPATGGCYWYPWYWGSVCGGAVPNKAAYEFTYGVGLGVRWDVNPGLFVKGSVNQQWIDMSSGGGTPGFTFWRLDLGVKF
jgi:opacity protein-like surface antigen